MLNSLGFPNNLDFTSASFARLAGPAAQIVRAGANQRVSRNFRQMKPLRSGGSRFPLPSNSFNCWKFPRPANGLQTAMPCKEQGKIEKART
jgi:hypothetical protein